MSKDIYEVYVHEAPSEADTTTEHQAIEAVRATKFTIEGNRIKGAHILGFKAQNYVKPNKEPYTYKDYAVKEAVSLYNNVDLYVGHTKTPTVGLRDPSEKIGFIENATFKEGVGAVGDLVLNEKHPSYESFMWWAEHKPEKLMLSHEAKCVYSAKENAMIAIKKVDCVAFVSEGSTTTTLVKEGIIGDKIEKEKMLEILMRTFDDIRYEVQWPIGKTLTQEEKAITLIPVIKDLLDEVSKLVPVKTTEAPTTTKKGNTMEFTDITLDTLTKNRKDLVDAITTQAVEAHIANEKAVTEAIKDIPSEYRSDLFVSQVREAVSAGSKDRLQAIVADRISIVTAAEAKAKEVPIVDAPMVIPTTKHTTTTKPVDKASIVALAKRRA